MRWQRCRTALFGDRSNSESAANPLVSVIVPTYNRAEILFERALPSIRRQSYDNLEILICDHGSTDDTEEAVLFAWLDDWRVRHIHVPRTETYPPTAENHWLAGPVAPITAGLKAAKGEWIARIDDDDIWTDDHIKLLLGFAETHRHEFVSSAYIGTRDGRSSVVHADNGIGGVQTWLYRSYLRFIRPNPHCWRKAWNRVNDTDLAERFRRAGVRTGYLDDVTAFVSPRPGETTIGLDAYRRDREAVEARLAF